MERDGRAVAASFFVEEGTASGATVTLPEAAAHHARVKRMDVGDHVRLMNGAGILAKGIIAAIDKKSVQVDVERMLEVPPPPPIHLRVPIGDRERMLWLAEKATELGIATWQVVRFRRSASVSPRGEGEAFAAKVRARMVSALEQSGGAWLPRVLPDVAVDALSFAANEQPILLDPAGPSIQRSLDVNREPLLLFGPEGGLDPSERDRLVGAGWQLASLANSVLRFETAGIAAVAVCRAHLLGDAGNG